MRLFLSLSLVCLSFASAMADETYQRTNNVLGTCLGEQFRLFAGPGNPYRSPEDIDKVLQRTCGSLEEKAEKEFFDYIKSRLLVIRTDKERAEVAVNIIAVMMTSHTRGGFRRMLIDAYSTAILKRK